MKHDYNNEASQSDRYAVLVNDKHAHKNTMLSHTHDADKMGGRYKAVHNQTVIGSQEQIQYPKASAWSCTSLPPEEPLGYEINSQEAVGTEAEIRASLGDVIRSPVAESNRSDLTSVASEGTRHPAPASLRSPHSPQALVRGKRDAGPDHSPLGQRLSAFKRRV
jgi:hypothetical protein